MLVTREQLHLEVWTSPMQEVAKKYGVAGTYLTRICKRLNVPRPPMGHWAKVRAGKNVCRIKLPEARVWDETEWAPRGRWEQIDPPAPEVPDREAGSAKPRHKATTKHPMVAGVEEFFTVGQETDTGYLCPSKFRLPDIVVSRTLWKRAFATFRRLVGKLERRGWVVTLPPDSHRYHRLGPSDDDRRNRWNYQESSFGWAPCQPTLAFCGTTAVGVTIWEICEVAEVEKIEGRWLRASSWEARKHRLLNFTPYSAPTYRSIPSGRLALRAYCPYVYGEWSREWREGEGTGLIGGMIDKVVEAMERGALSIPKLYGDAKHQAVLERAEWEAYCEERERQRAEERRRRRVQASRDQLIASAKSWIVACRLQDFLGELAARADKLPQTEREELTQRILAARELLGGTDPLTHFADWLPPEQQRLDRY